MYIIKYKDKEKEIFMILNLKLYKKRKGEIKMNKKITLINKKHKKN